MGEPTRPSRYFDFNYQDNDNTEEGPFQRSETNSPAHQKEKFGHQKSKKKLAKTPEEKKKLAVEKKEMTKKRQVKKRRIIIRNLSFKVEEEELKTVLSKYGNVVEVTIPKKKDGKKMGFAFAQFDNFLSCAKAIKELNFKNLSGRPIALDYAISKSKYEHTVSSRKTSNGNVKTEDVSDSESDDEDEDKVKIKEEEDDNDEPEMDEDEKRVTQVMDELGFKDGSGEEDKGKAKDDQETDDSSSSDDDDDDGKDDEDEEGSNDSEDDMENSKKRKLNEMLEDKDGKTSKKQKTADDTHEGKTVFVRNISFETTEEGFKEAMEEFGPHKYCLLCIDRVTEMPRGTAFIKFENKADADKLIEKSSDESSAGIFLDGRKLFCSLALSRDEMQKKADGNAKEKKDKRNLFLLREGVIVADSEEAKGLSPSDLAMRAKLEAAKKQKLKNLNFFVSKLRLCVHNIPFEYNNGTLYKLFKNSVDNKAVITEARIMRDFKKVDAKGQPRSKGFGFVEFLRHEDALAALKNLNNHPTAFTGSKRPIVEFSVENHQALLSKQRRQEKCIVRNNKRQADNDAGSEEASKNGQMRNGKGKKGQRFQKKPRGFKTDVAVGATPKQNRGGKKNFKPMKKSPGSHSPGEGVKNQKQKKKQKGDLKGANGQSLQSMVNTYKTKLLQKM